MTDDWQPVSDWQPVRPRQSLPQEIGSDVGSALKSAGSSIADYLNPFSEARHASYAKQAQLPIGQAFQENLSQIGGTGSALMAPLSAVGGTMEGVVNPPVARTFEAVNNLAGVNLPYEKYKEQTALALQGAAPKGASPRGVRPRPLQPNEAKAAGEAVFNDPAVKSIPIEAPTVNQVTGDIESTLMQRGFRDHPKSAEATFQEVNRLNKMTGAQGTERATPINLDDLRSSRMALNKYAGERTPASEGPPRPTPNAEAARVALEKVDALIDSVNPQVKTANANYSAGLIGESIDYRSGTAARRAAKTGSGSNIENTMRQEVDKIPNRGLTPLEIALKNKIVEGNFSRNTLRKIGKVGFGDGLSLMYHTALAAPSAGVVPAIGVAATGARKLGEALTRRQIGQLREMVLSRAPAASELRPPIKQSKKSAAIAAALLAGYGSK